MRSCCDFAVTAARRGDQPRPCHLQVWLATARPLTWVAVHGQAPYRGSHPWLGRLPGQLATTMAPCKGVIECCQGEPAGGRP
ncbi:hypothetical protein GW17_00033577 [Ensete ventricosum]|nr:hypothetical protein GW17_00033577 [Ensete ventricosum]